jgi:hypothetical protein
MTADTTTWGALLALGAFHGINPAMGWLFAVALGIQERRRAAVWRALVPLALGHTLAVGAAVIGVAALGLAFSMQSLRWPIAAALVALGVRQLVRHRHPRWAAMRVGMGRLTLWSFLMATAHGAGLMVLPVYAGMGMAPDVSGSHHHHGAALTAGSALLATSAHTLAYLLATTLVAALVFEKLGVGVLRTAWVNLDLVWAGALITTGAVSLVL